MQRKMWTKICIVVILFESTMALESDVHIYVSPKGSDKNDGKSPETAVKTLDKAMILARKTYGKNTMAYIELMAGYFDLEKTLYVFRDRVTIRPYKNEEVHVTGGKRVPSSLFKRVTDQSVLSRFSTESREYVRVAHLPDVGITNYGTMSSYGFAKRWTAPLEVFYNGKPLHFARYPNEGFINIVELLDGQNGTRFRYNSTQFKEPTEWHNESDPWTYGFWYNSWADRSVKLESLDASTGTVNLTKSPQFGLRIGHWNDPHTDFRTQGGYFRFINILSALDSPGEYYMDREDGNLYVWFPSKDGNANASDIIYVSLINSCIMIQNGQYITLEGFTLEACRGYGVLGKGAQHVQISMMEIRNTGSTALFLKADSRNCTVSQCLIHDTDGGIYIQGGNRPKLESSGNIIVNNEIFQFARVAAVGCNGISVNGVGHVVRYNHVYFGQNTAVMYYGNDILMEYNLLHHNCLNTTDCGAFHTGRDWTTRGNIIRYNIVHHNVRLVPGGDVRGVMLDDQSSSTSIMHNVFYNNNVHANNGGGRYNVMANNVMYNATGYSIQVDNRGIRHRVDKQLIDRLYAVPYNSSLWVARYPELAYLNLKNASLPEGNQIVKNLVFNTKGKEFVHGRTHAFSSPRYFNISETGFSLGKTDFYNVDAGDFRLKCHAAEWAKEVNFGLVVAPDSVGPRVPVGPPHMQRGLTTDADLTVISSPCTTKPPNTNIPVAAYLPDGSRENDLFNVSKEGCWLSLSSCTDHPDDVGTYIDTYGEKHGHAGGNETMCLQRAVTQWRYCGSHKNEQVAAIYGPSGATRLSGDGCFMARYGCPNHGGPVDGHAVAQGKIYRDKYAEKKLNASYDEEACLQRAIRQWQWCGSYRNHPVTSIYRPTGSVRTAGAGCWIQIQHCPKVLGTKSMFYDAWGASNFQTDSMELSCLNQAEYYWKLCGSDARYPVTANYRPTTTSKTYVEYTQYDDGMSGSQTFQNINSFFSSITSSFIRVINSARQFSDSVFQS